MERNDFREWFFKQVKSRWPKWTVNDITLGDWYYAFGKYDADVLTAAVRRHKIEDDTQAPSSKKILTILRARRPLGRRLKFKVRETAIDISKLKTIRQIQSQIRENGTRQERIKHIVTLASFLPDARKRDPEAYDWAVAEGRIKKAAKRLLRQAQDRTVQVGSAVTQLMSGVFS